MFFKKMKKIGILTSIMFLISNHMSFADVNVTRISGSDMYDTAVKVNDTFIDYSESNSAVLTNDSDFKTSLYGSYMASAIKMPFYLNGKHGISTKILNELFNKKIYHIYIVGDYNLLDKSIDNTLISKNIKFTRIYDKDKIDDFNGNHYTDKISEQVDNLIFNYFYKDEQEVILA
ncbi:cell wall-binding repeat-containing protein [Peptostreptococcus russellii]|uniref:cell wall-binding repeat-containing protein n=1 Tax=Peptostreptococcus russellii TaxID=215200 RepID=UPI00162A3322|nr:cell wall-binding repeat-containing protein [Peptostreptococcus russellii]MBC2578384.1 cell wall-binding repeat-containing protein [Peptostreptococcus russellii]